MPDVQTLPPVGADLTAFLAGQQQLLPPVGAEVPSPERLRFAREPEPLPPVGADLTSFLAIHAEGTTDLNSVRITNPDGTPVTIIKPDGTTAPLPPPVPQPPPGLRPFTRGRFTGLPGAPGTPLSQIPEPLTEGLLQFGRGAAALGRQLAQPPVLSPEPHVMQASPEGADKAALVGMTEVLNGAMRVATPLALAGAVANLPGTLLTLGVSYAATAAAGKAATLAKATPEMKGFLEAFAGATAALGIGGDQIRRMSEVGLDRAVKQVQDSAQRFVVAGQLAGAGYGPGDIPGGRGLGVGEFGVPDNPAYTEVLTRPRVTEAPTEPTPAPDLGLREPAPPPVLDLPLRDEAAQRPAPPAMEFQGADGQWYPTTMLVDPSGASLATVKLRPAQPEAQLPAGVTTPGREPTPPPATLDPRAQAIRDQTAPVAQPSAPAPQVKPVEDILGGRGQPEIAQGVAAPAAVAPAPLPPVGAEVPPGLATPPARIDEVTARRVGMPQDLADGINLMGDEARWRTAVTTPGSMVRHDDGFVGRVVEGAKDPVNGEGRDGRVLVEHEFEGQSAQRWYRATQLEPAPTAAPLPPVGAEAPPSIATPPAHIGTEAPNAGAAAPAPLPPIGAEVPPSVATPTAAAAPPSPPAMTPKEVLRRTLPDLGFTLSTDTNAIWTGLRHEARKVLKREPTGHEMRAVVEAWIAWARTRQAGTSAESHRRTRAALKRAAAAAKAGTTISGVQHEGQATAPAGPIAEGRPEERPATPSVGTEPTTERGARRRPSARERERSTAERESDTLDDLVATARRGGFTGDETALRAELRDRLQLIKDLDQEFSDAGRNPEVLLRAVAKAGGLSVSNETGLKGELRWLKEFQDNFGTRDKPRTAFGMVRGIRGVFNEQGLTVDGMLEYLRQDPAFSHIETIADLLDELQTAASTEPEKDAARRLEAGLGDKWWERIGHAVADEEAEGDISFNPEELEARPAVDVLDTGEEQPRLPEAGAVRDQEQATPTFEAPFSLTGEADTTPKERETSLFDRAADEPEAMRIEEPMRAPRGPRGPRGPRSQATPPRRPARPFMERDVIPSLKAASDGVVDAHSNMRALWAPARVSESADVMATIMRPNLALRRQRDARARKTMRRLEVAWDRMPQAQQLAFAMAVDEGRIDDLPESQREVARLLDAINRQKRREANALGGKVGYIEHYFPREWVQPGKVREYVMRALYGKRPLQGRAGFKKARARDKETGEIFTFRELIDAGFEPVSYNPITAHLRKWTEMDKWIAARRILLEGKANGIAKFVKVGEKPPDGWVRYPDSFGIVYGPPTIPVKEAYDAGLMEALHRFAAEHDITLVRRLNLGGQRWGYHVRKADRSHIHTQVGGPEGVLMHEIGHALDHSHGLGEKIGLAQASERREEINFAETPTKVLKELRALADLRLNKTDSPSHKRYVRNRAEVIANLVHAFLYAPDLAKQVAPNAYWALYNLAKDTPDLRGLLDIQKARSLRFGVNVTNARIEGRVIKGQYYGPPDAVRLLENHLSPGLRGHVAFDLYRHAGNFLNRVQLGLSAFHAVFTGLDVGLSQGALALEQASRGHVRAAARMGAPGLAVTAGTAATVFGGPIGAALGVPLAVAGILVPTVRGLFLGDKLLKGFYERDAQLRELVHEADVIAAGGGGVGWDTFWHASAPEAFMKALRNAKAEAGVGNYPGAALRSGAAVARAVPAILEAQAKPIMEWWVPRLKLAAFMDLARMELADLGPHPDPMEARRVLQSAWRSVDNRFGELIYDNLFWHAILKDAGMASVRALGFSVGTIDELFGAIPAQLAQVGLLPSVGSGGGGWGKPPTRLRNTGEMPDPEGGPPVQTYARTRAPWLHHKFAYLLSAVWFAAIFGALYQYLHTGLRPGEKEDGSIDPSKRLLDLYFPRTGGTKQDGRPERASLPGYMKDYVVFNTHPLLGVEHKLHPMLTLTADILRNEDYFGSAIHSEETPRLQQIGETLAFIAKQYKPISFQGFEQRGQQRGEGRIGALESFLGINVAPQSVTRSAVEEYLHSVAPPIHRTTEEAARAEARRDLRTARQAGDPDAARGAIEAGNLTRRSVLASARSARLTALQRSFDATTLSHAISAYEIATPEERGDLKPLLAQKWHRLFPEVAPGLKRATADRFKAAIALPVAQPADRAEAASR